MSFKVAVVCEDFTFDQYIVRPVLTALLDHIGKPRARVTVVTNPRLAGWARLMDEACEVLARYGAGADLVIFIGDADCLDGTDGRGDRLAQLESVLESCGESSDKAVAAIAIQELEVWALWGMRASLNAQWAQVRAHCHPKGAYFTPLLTAEDERRPDKGRSRMVLRALHGGWASLSGGCPELAALEEKVRTIAVGN